MISVSKVTKNFDEVHALKEVNLDIATGEFVTIVGPSGCGKSTLLRIIAGLISTQGDVKKPDKGAFVFQDAALLPWRTVQKNAELLMELEDGCWVWIRCGCGYAIEEDLCKYFDLGDE